MRLAGVALTVALSTTATPALAEGLDWHRCKDDRSYDCATFAVPKDWDHPNRHGSYRLDVRRLPALTGDKPTLFINPGGPGASGADYVSTFEDDKRLRKHYNIVGFDPRGVGGSTPLPRRCSPTDRITPRPATGPFSWQPVVGQYARNAASRQKPCWRRNSASRPWMATRYVIRDLDALRQAVGDRRLSYYGISYGTTIGRGYANRYPDRIRVMLLDGVTGPTENQFDKMRIHVRGAQSAWRMLHDGMPAPVRRLYAAVVNQLGQAPTQDIDRWSFWAGAMRAFTPDDLAQQTCGVAEELGLELPAQCATAASSEATSAAAVVPLVFCLDLRGRPDARQIAGAIDRAGIGPEAAGNVIQYATFCSGVPRSKVPLPPVRDLRTSFPPLLINGLWDISTPYPGAKQTRSQIRGSRLIGVRTKIHGVFTSPVVRSRCTHRAVYRYLIDRELPAEDRVCAARTL